MVKDCHKCGAFDSFHFAHLQWAVLNTFSERLALTCTLKGNKNNFWKSAYACLSFQTSPKSFTCGGDVLKKKNPLYHQYVNEYYLVLSYQVLCV